MTRRLVILAMTAIAVGLGPRASVAQGTEPDREISAIKGDLYRLRVDDRHAVFLVTANGVVLVDPLSSETAQWLEDELVKRFPEGIVRFVLHTSHKFDRAEGGGILNGTAELIGHREFNTVLSQARAQRPPALPAVDHDTDARVLRTKDRDGDGTVTATELYGRVHDVETYFDDRRVITIGGRTVEIARAPTPAFPEGAIVNFPAERVAFAADAPIGDEPFRFGSLSPHAVQRWLNAVQDVQFDVLLLGNGRSIQRVQLNKISAYVNDLVTRVAAEYERGTPAAEFARSKMPGMYRSDPAFREWRAHVDDFYRDVSVFRIDAMAGGMANYVQRDNTFCESFTTCSSGGIVPALAGGISASIGRFAIVGEVTASEDAFSSRTSRFYDEDFALRETRIAVMARRIFAAGPTSYRLLGGMSYAIAYRSGLSRIKEGLPPFAGRHPIESREVRWGVTGGLDLVMGNRFGLVFPVRFNFTLDPATATWPSRIDAQAGVAISLRLFRSVD